jgi:hypothetical protein
MEPKDALYGLQVFNSLIMTEIPDLTKANWSVKSTQEHDSYMISIIITAPHKDKDDIPSSDDRPVQGSNK